MLKFWWPAVEALAAELQWGEPIPGKIARRVARDALNASVRRAAG
jgi:hypothetical protein